MTAAERSPTTAFLALIVTLAFVMNTVGRGVTETFAVYLLPVQLGLGATGFGFLQNNMRREFDAELFAANFAEQLFVIRFRQLFLGHFVGRSKFDDEFAVFRAQVVSRAQVNGQEHLGALFEARFEAGKKRGGIQRAEKNL